MFRSVFSHFVDVGLEDVIPVHVRHFSRIFQPYFVFSVLGQVIEGSHVQSEFAGFCEFSETETDRSEILTTDVRGAFSDGFTRNKQ